MANIGNVLKARTSFYLGYLAAARQWVRLAPSAIPLFARYGRPEMFISFGGGIGDDLLLTVIFRELHLRNYRRLWTMSRNPEVFQFNDDLEVVIPFHERYRNMMKRLRVKVVNPWYTDYNPAYDRDDPHPEQHIISIMCQKAGILGQITLKPHFVLHESEKGQGQVMSRQIAIQTSGLAARHAMNNKNWFVEGYQDVVSSLKSKYNFVQIGSPSDPPLEGVLDLRGKTSIRQTAALLSHSLVFVGQVGFLMHLARAVDCRSVVIYGGREHPSQSGYTCNENLYSEVGCSPCWRLNTCPYDRECMQRISAADVVSAVETQAEKYGTPLACDTDTITQEQAERYALRYAEATRSHLYAWSVIYNRKW